MRGRGNGGESKGGRENERVGWGGGRKGWKSTDWREKRGGRKRKRELGKRLEYKAFGINGKVMHLCESEIR